MVKVHSTMDYTKFKFVKRNRIPVYRKDIEKTLIKHGWLPQFPMVVNKNHEVLDGQHRFIAAQKLNFPIFYIISENLTQEDIPGLQCGKNWCLHDYLHSFCADNNPDFIVLKDLLDKYKLSLNVFISCYLKSRKGQTNIQAFKNGKLNLTFNNWHTTEFELKKLSEVIEIINKNIRLLDIGKKLNLKQTNALSFFIRKEKYCHSRFTSVLEKNVEKCFNITKFSCPETLEKHLLNIYNHALKINKLN